MNISRPGKSPSAVAVFAAAIFLANGAFAAGGKEESVKGDRSGGGGGGASGGPGGGGPGGGGSSDSTNGVSDIDFTNPDRADLHRNDPKKWEIAGSFESHRLFVQNDLQGAASDKFFNYYQAYAKWLPTKNDEVAAYFGVYQRFIADPNETGFRLDDILVRYSRYVTLPAQSSLYLRAGVYIPTSFVSHKEGTVGAGRLTVGFEKYWGKYVLTGVRAYGEGYWQTYDAPQGGGNPNPLARMAAAAEVRVYMPFHPALSAGVEAYTAYTWFLRTQGQPVSSFYGATADNQFSQQPIQQVYGGEIFLSYDLPAVRGLRTEIHVAAAQGDPALGYTSSLHDGISHSYFYWRESSEIYASLLARY